MAVTAALLIFAAPWMSGRAQDARPTATPASLPVSTTRPQVTFAFERKGLPVPKFRLAIQDDGATVYEGEEVPQVSGQGSSVSLSAHAFRSTVVISPATAAHIFTLGQKLNRFNITCASKAKNIADTGTKTLSYVAADGTGSCTYNYTENKDVQALTEIIQGIAETMDQGRELDHLHRFDRLGLDAAITFLAQEVSEGHALELGTIAASLRSIATDAEVMERVRMRASKLLALIPAEVPQNGP
jgi:hypothetical protein